MAMTADGANWNWAAYVGDATPDHALATNVTATATVVVSIHNRTDETTTITSVVGSLNGAYTLAEGPTDHTTATMRMWSYYFLNSAGGAETITVTFSGAINSNIVAGWCLDDAGAQTFDVDVAGEDGIASHPTDADADSPTLSAAGGGGILGFIATNNVVTFSADGAGETNIEGGAGGQRLTAFFEAYASGGTKGFEATGSGNTRIVWHVLAFLTPAAGGGTAHRATTRRLLVGMG